MRKTFKDEGKLRKWFRKNVLRQKVLTPQEDFKVEQRDFISQLLKSTMMFFELLKAAEVKMGWSRKRRKQVWRDLEKGFVDGKIAEAMQEVVAPILSAAKVSDAVKEEPESQTGKLKICTDHSTGKLSIRREDLDMPRYWDGIEFVREGEGVKLWETTNKEAAEKELAYLERVGHRREEKK